MDTKEFGDFFRLLGTFVPIQEATMLADFSVSTVCVCVCALDKSRNESNAKALSRHTISHRLNIDKCDNIYVGMYV